MRKKYFGVSFLTMLAVIFLITFNVFGKELPLLVDISELSAEHDGKRIVVMGWARSAETMRGRMGSQFVKTEIGEGEKSVTVYSDFPPYNIVNNRVIVQGIYHQGGRFGGLLAKPYFIVAESMVKDWRWRESSDDVR